MNLLNASLLREFSALLSYPDHQVRELAAGCALSLDSVDPLAATAFARFEDYLAEHDLANLEELFAATFELQAHCQPYVGYQLCGENQARTLLLMKLQELYLARGFSCGSELPDHLGVMLRYLAHADDPAGRLEIIRDALLPALDKMLAGFDNPDHPYRQLLTALRICLQNTVEPALPDLERQKEMSHG